MSFVRFIVLFSSGHHWPFFLSWNFSFVITFSSRRRNGLVSSLHHFQVLSSSVLPFVNWATYKTAISQLFPPSLHEAHTGQNKMAKGALAKIENKSEEQQPSTPKGGFRGWPRGPRSPLFLWNFVLFLWNALKHKKYLYSWQVSRPSLSGFSGSAPASPFASTRSFANALEKDLKQVYSSYIHH